MCSIFYICVITGASTPFEISSFLVRMQKVFDRYARPTPPWLNEKAHLPALLAPSRPYPNAHLSSVPGNLATAAPMFRGILAYLVVEALYLGFTLAYVFVKQGFDATLYVFLAQSVALALGYHLGLAAMSRSEKACSRTLQVSGVACSASMLLAVNAPLWALAPLLVLAGVAFGAAIGSKQWHEINNTRGSAREAYLFWSEVSHD